MAHMSAFAQCNPACKHGILGLTFLLRAMGTISTANKCEKTKLMSNKRFGGRSKTNDLQRFGRNKNDATTSVVRRPTVACLALDVSVGCGDGGGTTRREIVRSIHYDDARAENREGRGRGRERASPHPIVHAGAVVDSSAKCSL